MSTKSWNDHPMIVRAREHFPRLYDHQREGLKRWRRPGYAFFWQQRAGKSVGVEATAIMQFVAGEIDCVVVFAPNGVHSNWVCEEIPKWTCPGDHVVFFWDSGMSKTKQRAEFDAVFEHGHGGVLRWFVFPISVFKAPRFAPYYEMLRHGKLGRVLLVVDESHEYRTHSSIRSTKIRAIARACPYRRILTGTPRANGPLDLWAQLEIVEPGLLGPSYHVFAANYGIWEKARTKNGSFMRCTGYRNLDDLNAKVAQYASFKDRKDVKGLPDLIRRTKIVGREAQAEAAYRNVIDGLRAQTADGAVIPPREGGGRLLQLQQIAGGWARDEKGVPQPLFTKYPARIEATLRFALGVDHAIVYALFTHEIDALVRALRALGEEVAEYSGRISVPERDVIRRRFAAGEIRVVVGQPQACATGIDLSRAHRIIWYSQTWDGYTVEQANERASKIGGGAIEVYTIVGFPIDAVIAKRLESKRALASRLDASAVEELALKEAA